MTWRWGHFHVLFKFSLYRQPESLRLCLVLIEYAKTHDTSEILLISDYSLHQNKVKSAKKQISVILRMRNMFTTGTFDKATTLSGSCRTYIDLDDVSRDETNDSDAYQKTKWDPLLWEYVRDLQSLQWKVINLNTISCICHQTICAAPYSFHISMYSYYTTAIDCRMKHLMTHNCKLHLVSWAMKEK